MSQVSERCGAVVETTADEQIATTGGRVAIRAAN